jgi:hypothetical protein
LPARHPVCIRISGDIKGLSYVFHPYAIFRRVPTDRFKKSEAPMILPRRQALMPLVDPTIPLKQFPETDSANKIG